MYLLSATDIKKIGEIFDGDTFNLKREVRAEMQPRRISVIKVAGNPPLSEEERLKRHRERALRYYHEHKKGRELWKEKKDLMWEIP